MKRFRFMPKLAAAIVSAAMIFSGAVPAFADDANKKLTVNTNKVQFTTKLKLNMRTSAAGITKKIPAKTFHYTIAPGSYVAGSTTTNNDGTTTVNLPIYAGVGKPTIAETKISANEDVKSDEVSATSEIDFSTVKFTQPGIYRYEITNGDQSDSAYTGDFGATKRLDISVINSNTGLVIDAATLSGMDDKGQIKKVDGFDFNYATTFVKFTKNVEGNQGDQNKSFDFNVKLENVVSNATSVDVYLPGAITATSLTSNDNFTKTYQLKHNQTITIENIPAGASFSVSENKSNLDADGYQAKLSNDDITNKSGVSMKAVTVDNTIYDEFSKSNLGEGTTFTIINTKEGTVPTGVIFAVAPFAIGAVAIAAFVILKVRKAAKQ